MIRRDPFSRSAQASPSKSRLQPSGLLKPAYRAAGGERSDARAGRTNARTTRGQGISAQQLPFLAWPGGQNFPPPEPWGPAGSTTTEPDGVYTAQPATDDASRTSAIRDFMRADSIVVMQPSVCAKSSLRGRSRTRAPRHGPSFAGREIAPSMPPYPHPGGVPRTCCERPASIRECITHPMSIHLAPPSRSGREDLERRAPDDLRQRSFRSPSAAHLQGD